MNFAGKTDRGLSRSQNEDAFCIIGGSEKTPLIMAVADGMGGHKAGDIASKMAMEIIQESFKKKPLSTKSYDSVTTRLFEIIKKANDAIFRKSISDPACIGMGTTLIIAVVDNNALVVAHIGDSCVYHFRNKVMKKITTDHTYVEELVRIGTLTRAEALIHPKRNYITKAVGCTNKVDADLYNITLEEADRVLIFTDGLSKMLTDSEILKIVYSSDDSEVVCERLIEKTNANGGIDNTTAVVLLNVNEVL